MKRKIYSVCWVVFCKKKPLLALTISENLTKEKGWNAGQLIRDLAKEIEGGGGGQPFFATAGGKKIEGLDSALLKPEVSLI